MQEIWTPYPEFPHLFEVSNLLRIRSVAREYMNGNKGMRTLKPKVLAYRKDSDGYWGIGLRIGNGLRPGRKRSRIIAITFIPNPENKPCVNHINGIKDDDRIENLEWCTLSENSTHSVRVLGNTPPLIPAKHRGEHPSAVPIIRISKCGNIFKYYNCARDADDEGFRYKKISNVLRGGAQTYKGYSWKYANDLSP